MNGLTIFSHSLRQVVGNLNMAVRISWWFVAIVLAVMVVGMVVLPDWLLAALKGAPYEEADIAGGEAILFLIGTLAALVFSAWAISLIAIVWHRYILLEEVPQGIIPYRGDFRIGRYFWYGVGIYLIAGLVVALVGSVLGMAFGVGAVSMMSDASSGSIVGAAFLIGLVLGVAVTVLYLRLALILPAVALDEGLTIGGAWEASAGYTGAIVVTALVLTFLNIIVGTVLEMASGTVLPEWLYYVLSGGFNWFYFMLNISILSTLYGHIVQKREVY